jgi:CHAD domain-containing protein
MDRNYDEEIAELTIQVVALQDELADMKSKDVLTIKRVVKLENRLEFLHNKVDSLKIAFDEYIAFQSRLNSAFLDHINRNPK